MPKYIARFSRINSFGVTYLTTVLTKVKLLIIESIYSEQFHNKFHFHQFQHVTTTECKNLQNQ